jgi:hypothetical protein
MRYYVYVSETKVDQLYAQVPDKLRNKIATKLTVDLKVIKAEFQGVQTQESLFSKLTIVEQYLEGEGLVGTPDEPKSFFSGTMRLRWGFMDTVMGTELSLDEIVFFSGRTDETVVGLGGSRKHVLGEVGRTLKPSGSLTFTLGEALGQVNNSEEYSARVGLPDGDEGVRDLEGNYRTDALLDDVAAVSLGTWNPGPGQPMEFLAKRLAFGPVNPNIGKFAILGTPLFVAMAD